MLVRERTFLFALSSPLRPPTFTLVVSSLISSLISRGPRLTLKQTRTTVPFAALWQRGIPRLEKAHALRPISRLLSLSLSVSRSREEEKGEFSSWYQSVECREKRNERARPRWMETFPTSLLEREPRYKPECTRILRAHRRCIQRIGKMAVIASRPAKKLRNASLTRPISLGLTPGRREWLIIVAEACWIFSSFFIFTFFLFAAITIRHHLYFLTEQNRNALASLDV